uniref:Uncharacterized protein n=1 Tax=Romanomermis culicivorax TaxID=13658 RepID=A0A915JR28_ROMCU
MNITVQKLLVNGGGVGECRRQIEFGVDNPSGCDCFGSIGGYDSCGGHEDHCGHQNERHGSCGCDCDWCCGDDGMTKYTFAIEAEREVSHPEAAIA